MPGYFVNSGLLFREAKKAYGRTADARAEGAGRQHDALGSIVFAAAALEAWIGEMARLAACIAELFSNAPLTLDYGRDVVRRGLPGASDVELDFFCLAAALLPVLARARDSVDAVSGSGAWDQDFSDPPAGGGP